MDVEVDGLGREEGGEGREGRDVGTGLGREDGGARRETGGTWVGTGLGREDGGERDGRCVGGDGVGEGGE